MSLENAQFIWEFVRTNPQGGDPLAQADDHMRMIKGAIQDSFPGMTAPWETSSVIKAADPVAPQDLVTLAYLGNAGNFAAIGAPFLWLLDALPVVAGLEFADLDGRALDRTLYDKLFAQYGVKYGTGNGTTTFNIPDVRGYFPRFQYPTTPSGDPDIATRTVRADGATQGAPGTTQADELKSHRHDQYATAQSFAANFGGAKFVSNEVPFGTTGYTGGAETRAKNINIRLVMRVK